MDRNPYLTNYHFSGVTSLSARRAWIEIGLPGADKVSHQVALRKESVDRNRPVAGFPLMIGGRSPQGERG